MDAILASVPEQPVAPRVNQRLKPNAEDLQRYAGRYPLTIQFEPAAVVLNPARWQQTGARVH